MVAIAELVNKGFIVNQPVERKSGSGGRTFIVTGLHRSGTSLVASILQQAGVFIGTEINDIVYEDEEIARILASRDIAALRQIIGERNADYGTWGFKQPMLCNDLGEAQLALFDDPHLIVTFRDLVSMSLRTALSEYQEPKRALRDTMNDLNALMAFIDGTRCPSLLLSYEKALVFPHDFVDAVMQFCDIPQNPALHDRLVGLIEPNRPSYIASARRRYEGLIEGIMYDHLYGWCRLSHSDDPVSLDVLVDERPVLSVVADVFRQDLLDARIGSGYHGFTIPMSALGAQPDAVIRIRVAGQGIDIGNSGQRMQQFSSGAG